MGTTVEGMAVDAELFMSLVITCLTLYVVVACICRVNLLDPKAHKRTWSLFYIGWVYFAGNVLISSMARQPPLYVVVGLAAIAVNLWMTRATWNHAPPRVTHKEPTAPVQLDVVGNRAREIINVNVEAGRDLGDDLRGAGDDYPVIQQLASKDNTR